MGEKGREIQVVSVDLEKEEIMQRDSNLEMEMLELFEDITLENVVASKACVGKVVGCKNMPASVVKKILGGVWRRLGFWRMKKCEDGVLGFFFDEEDDYHFVMERRPWIINGVLLNLKPWPVEGEVHSGEFEVASFWVQFHGLPTRFLSNENIPILAKKVGNLIKQEEKSKEELVRRGYLRSNIEIWLSHPFPSGFFLKADGKPDSWVQFKYEKLPHLCFSCGKLAHWEKICSDQPTMVYSKIGPAVPMYGTWIKSETGRSNCFNMKGKGTSQLIIEREEVPEWELPRNRGRNTWKRHDKGLEKARNSGESAVVTPAPGEENGVEKDKVGDSTMIGGHKRKIVQEATPTIVPTVLGTGEVCKRTEGISVGDGIGIQNMENVGDRQMEVLNMVNGPGYLELPIPDFSLGLNDEERIPDIGPTIAQSLEIPHSWLCRSQRPHDFPEPTPLKWPNDDPKAQELFFKLYSPDATDIFELPSCPTTVEVEENGKSHTEDAITPKFCLGSEEGGEKQRRKSSRRTSQGSRMLNIGSGVKTRRGRKRAETQQCEINEFAGRGGGLKHAPTIIMRCISWNCRGIRRPTTERTLRSLIQENNVDVVFLSETKVGIGDMTMVMNRLGFPNVACIPSVGIGGGFCLAWRQPGLIELMEVFDTGFHAFVPANQGSVEPWVVLGDLNVILEGSEKVRGREFQSREGAFLRDFMDETGSVDLGFQGVRCTWHNARKGLKNVRKRLDRGLAEATWCTHFPNAKVLNLPVLASDHSPILLSTCEAQQRLNYPFRFMEVWTSSPDCEKVIDLAWKYDFNGRRDDILIKKLGKTKRELKMWNQNSFGFCDRKLRMFKQELVEIQNKLPSKENLEREATVQLCILEMESNLERIWKQKSREHWVCKGDGNTKFFHASTVIRRRRNTIESVNNDGTWLHNREDIGNYMRNQFIKVYDTQHTVIEDDFDSLFSELVSEEENLSICRMPTAEEIKQVVFALHPLKSPGPDGFSGIFYRKYWRIVGVKADGKNAATLIDCISREEVKSTMDIDGLSHKEKYLGNPFFFSARKRRDFQFLKDKVMGRLEGWKAKNLSQAGRTTLVGSVLQSIPCYTMSTAMVPKTVCDELDRIVACFWWTGNAEKQRYRSFKSWSEICQPKRCGGLGLRRFRDINVALLAKLSWGMLSRADKAWVNLMEARYCRGLDAWRVEKKLGDSWVWQGILEARKVCKMGAGVLIGDGVSDLWERPWVPGVSIEEVRNSFTYSRRHAFVKVSDLFLEGSREWNSDIVKDCFEEDVAQAILSIRPLETSNDMLFWTASKSGKFTVKSGYWLSQKGRFKDPNKVWEKLWQSSIHPRLKLLLWKLWSDVLPTKMRIGIRDEACVLCHNADESALHLFGGCSVIKAVLFHSKWGIRVDDLHWNTIMDFGLWWTTVKDESLQLFVACACDSIWKWRNNVIFKNRPFEIDKLLSDIHASVQEMHLRHVAKPGEVSLLATQDWTDPFGSSDLIPFHTDASILNDEVGCAAVLRAEEDGKMAWVATDFKKGAGILEGELLAILLALQVARQRNITKIKVLSDSKVAVMALNLGCLPLAWGTYPVFESCLCLCKCFDQVVFCFCPRSKNRVADALARWARGSKSGSLGVLRDIAPSVAMTLF
uniref:Reverse transcriptase n=1 Tax=Cannabis sativa TaxID=3483 RepID=A0A803Q031_CANSA